MTSRINIGNPTGLRVLTAGHLGFFGMLRMMGEVLGGLGQCEVTKYIMQEGYAQVLGWPLYARSYDRRNL